MCDKRENSLAQSENKTTAHCPASNIRNGEISESRIMANKNIQKLNHSPTMVAPPLTETLLDELPNQFLKQLLVKHPNLLPKEITPNINVLTSKKFLNKTSAATTYQVDYGDISKFRFNTPQMERLMKGKEKEEQTEMDPRRLPGDPYRAGLRCPISKNGFLIHEKFKEIEFTGKSSKYIPKWTTDYRQNISKLGKMINGGRFYSQTYPIQVPTLHTLKSE